MEEGTIVRWAKAEGDKVAQGDILLEIETDKATIEVESEHSGILRKIVVPEGETVEVHKLIAYIGEADEAIPEGPQAQPEPAEAKPAPQPSSAPEGSVTPVLMPQAGQSMEEGTIVEWKVKPGDTIKEGDIIFEVETDKAAVEVEATDSGRLSRIVLPEGETIEVLKPVAYLADNDADVDAYLAGQGEQEPAEEKKETPASPKAAEAAPQAVAPETPVEESTRVKASPAARKIAREKGVDLAQAGPGRGPGGRILSTDVEKAAAAQPVAAQAKAAAAPKPVDTEGQAVRRKMSGMRKAIARNLAASKQNIPHFYMRLTIDAEALFAFYRAEKAKYPCSLNDVIVLACAKCIQEFPAFRSQLDGDDLLEFPHSNIGIAVGLDNGLVVPVVLGAEQMTLQQLAGESRRVVDSARTGKIEGMGQGVFTISNLGMFGVDEFSAIINPPEAAILAISGVRETVVVKDGFMRPGREMTMTLSCDHRIIDGLLAAKFLARLKEILQAPVCLL
jgi:pyruvate dehydrogenase E2 component (dihydrolipoamide acetyltransferase)